MFDFKVFSYSVEKSGFVLIVGIKTLLLIPAFS